MYGTASTLLSSSGEIENIMAPMVLLANVLLRQDVLETVSIKI